MKKTRPLMRSYRPQKKNSLYIFRVLVARPDCGRTAGPQMRFWMQPNDSLYMLKVSLDTALNVIGWHPHTPSA
ncbi:hypothetical protein BR10RB9215_C10243 [Brucella sp. 10RB9215]|nr:hypothetical protein BR10RB9215_C10243 [Brucella sp. 10RB9215]